MSKFKLGEIKLPSVDEITRGMKQPTVKAEQIAEEADRTLDERRKDLAELQLRVDKLPDLIYSGRAAAKDLASSLEKRDRAKARLQEATANLAQAKERAVAERAAAKAAYEVDFESRVKQLEDVVALINPVLLELSELAFALAKARDGAGVLALEWAASPHTLMMMRPG